MPKLGSFQQSELSTPQIIPLIYFSVSKYSANKLAPPNPANYSFMQAWRQKHTDQFHAKQKHGWWVAECGLMIIVWPMVCSYDMPCHVMILDIFLQCNCKRLVARRLSCITMQECLVSSVQLVRQNWLFNCTDKLEIRWCQCTIKKQITVNNINSK